MEDKFFKKIQKASPCQKKIFIFAIIFILALPLIFFVAKNFQQKLKEFKKEEFLKELNLPKVKEEVKNIPLKEIEETKQKLEELMITLTTSTNNQ
ncbi:MAG: hypothetical protein QMC93_01380 [Patescibacteria group bacterium]|nr:hypothetical protein [Patescibacteria group bacterium]